MTRSDRADDDGTAASFVRGLTIGALLGAAVAGSSLWSRRRRARQARQATVSVEDPSGAGSTGAAVASIPDQASSEPTPEG